MQIVLAGESALAFWVWATRPDSSLRALRQCCGNNAHDVAIQPLPQRRGTTLAQALLNNGPQLLPSPYKLSISHAQIEGLCNELGIVGPLLALVKDKTNKRTQANLITHSLANISKLEEFYEPIKGLFISSPRLVYAQMSRGLSIESLIMLGYELCGEYSTDEAAERGFYNRTPLTNTNSICNLINASPNLGNKQAALRALNCIVEGTASPAESQLSAMLTIPTRFGGFGFKRPKANAIVLSDAKSQKVSKRNWRACDLFWEEELVDVEYDSEAFHSTREQRFEDSVRRNALVSSKIRVISVTPGQLRSREELATVALVLASALNKRRRTKVENFNELNKKLHQSIIYDYPKWRRELFDNSNPNSRPDQQINEGNAVDNALEPTLEPFYEIA